VLLLFLFFLVGCPPPPFSLQIDETILQEGDLVFRRGMSVASRVVLAADKEGGYSHIGIIVKDATGWKVIHAVPGETDKEYPEEIVKKETLSQFFAPKRAVSGAIFRLDTNENIGVLAAEKAQTLFERKLPFDHKYNLEDSTEMYCTELIVFAFQYAGIDISEGRRRTYPAIRGEFILPSDILAYPKLKKIWRM
ncbi:MAG: hypothetical protein FWC34_05000, partial [Bacteroidetes bacterium]|nr:hypothetical protein [Bacteroidota bacterium]